MAYACLIRCYNALKFIPDQSKRYSRLFLDEAFFLDVSIRIFEWGAFIHLESTDIGSAVAQW